jgi:hypothetical protein
MSCEQLKTWWPEYWDDALGHEERRALEAHFASCEACRREARELRDTWQALAALPDEEPSPLLRQRFDALLEGWQAREREQAPGELVSREQAPWARATRDRVRWWQSPFAWPAGALAAAALLLIVGFLIGRDTSGTSSRTEIAELRNELHGMRQMVAISLLHQESVTERLRGVSWSYQLDSPDAEIVNTLLDTLGHDQNVNVRLAAIDALRQFARTSPDQQNQPLRAALMRSIDTQPSPLVQIALINTMVELREHRAVDVLRTLAADANTNKAVRQRATWGVRQLS